MHAEGKFFAATVGYKLSGFPAFALEQREVTPAHWQPMPKWELDVTTTTREDMTTPLPLREQLSNAVGALAQAQDHLRLMAARTADARRNECSAINQANEAQRAFDAIVAEVKKSAPADTDWKRPIYVAMAAS